MTKPLLLPFFFLLLMGPAVFAEILGHSPPSAAVEYARDIAVGVVQVSRTNGLEVRFTPQMVLKGHMQPGSTYIVDYTNDRTRLNYPNVLPQIAAYAEGKPAVLFLGSLQVDGKTLVPDSMEGAVWPRDNKFPRLATPDTLEECISFVKALLADPKLKLKEMNGRRVLPDGYALAMTNTGAAQPDDDTRVMTYLPPAEAVESARDIVVGTVQVSRTNGLEVRFTVQSVLKGNMQSGDIYIVKHHHKYPSLLESLEQIAAATKDKPAVMLLGRLQPDGRTFEPEGLDSAVWPRSAKWGGVFQTPDTLEGCITFVKALVANPKLKLKIVNDRQMLPDDYTPPPSAAPKAP